VVTLAAAVVFFGCAGTLVFRKGIVLEPARLARGRRAVLVTVDPDEAWRTHLRWLERSQMRRVGLA
jgi:hypothetical protein